MVAQVILKEVAKKAIKPIIKEAIKKVMLEAGKPGLTTLQNGILDATLDHIGDPSTLPYIIDIGSTLVREMSASSDHTEEEEKDQAKVDSTTCPSGNCEPNNNCKDLKDEISKALYANKRAPGETDGYHGLLNRVVEQICGASGPGTLSWDNHNNEIKGAIKRLKDKVSNFKKSKCPENSLSQSERDLINNIINGGKLSPNSLKWLGPNHPHCINVQSVVSRGRLSDLLGIIRP